MQTYYTKWYSPSVGREMEIKVYGHAGRPVLFIPCQDGRFFDFENYRMTDAWAPWIESGQCMVFSIDTLDKETYSATYDPHDRIRRHEAWMNYIVREVAPFIQSMTNDRNGWDGTPGIIAFGCSLGATHAANLYFRFPETFDGLLALSGIYTANTASPATWMSWCTPILRWIISPEFRPTTRLSACTTTTRRWLSSGRARGKCRRAHSDCVTSVRRRTFMSGSTFGATM